MEESNTNPTVKTPRLAYFHLTMFLSTLLSVFFCFAVPSSFSITSTAPLCFH